MIFILFWKVDTFDIDWLCDLINICFLATFDIDWLCDFTSVLATKFSVIMKSGYLLVVLLKPGSQYT